MSVSNPLLIAKLDVKVRELEAAPYEGFDPAELRAYNQRLRKARMRLARAKGRHDVSEWEAIVAETGGICVRCGYQHDLEHERPVKGHVVQIAGGGDDSIGNIQPLCRRCMSAGSDGTRWLDLWREGQAK